MEPEKKTHTVWVGNLSEEMTEHILFSEFKHYGPICSVKLQQSRDGRRIGFINFYSKEVAEVAANDMDGADVCGIKIKTSFKSEEHKRKDVRPLTDCQHFIANSCTKGESCMFRHNESAKMSSVDCSKWLAGECMDISCNKRHPGRKKAKNNKVIPTDNKHSARPSPILNQAANQILRTAELLVTNLPFEPSDEAMAKARLRAFSDSCGGRVSQICRDKYSRRAHCVISFASADDADRAHRRMQGQDVCGKKILVEQYWGRGKIENDKQDAARGFNPRQDKISLHRMQRLRGADTMKSVSLDFLPGAAPKSQTAQSNWNAPPMHNKHNNSQNRPMTGPANQHTHKPFQHPKLKKAASQSSINYKMRNAFDSINPLQPAPTIQDAIPLLDKVKSIIGDFPRWLSLKQFAAKFNKVYKEKLSLLQFLKIRKSVFIDGKPGRIFICLRGSHIDQVPIYANKADFQEKLFSVMAVHKKSVPIESIFGMMWSYEKQPKKDPSGIPLWEMLSNCPGVKRQKFRIFFSSSPYDVTEDPSRFIAEAEHILSSAHNWELSLEDFPKSYEWFFGTAMHGISDIQQFINEFADRTLEVTQRNDVCLVAFSISRRLEILGSELLELLSKEKNPWMPIVSLPKKYFTFYGREVLHSKDIDRLISHIKALDRKDLYVFKNKDDTVCVGAKKGPDETFINFKQGLVSLLHSRSDKKILLNNLESEYESFHGRFPLLKNLGFDHPNDLFEAMKPEIKMKKSTNGICILLCENAQRSMWDYVLGIIRSSKEPTVLLSSLPQYIQDRKESLLSSAPNFITVINAGESVHFVLNSNYTGNLEDRKSTETEEKRRSSKLESIAKMDTKDLDQKADFVVSQINNTTANASVMLENEDLIDLDEFSDSTLHSQSDNEINLLDLSEAESEPDQDWWMQDVPDLLPSPGIRPEPAMFGSDLTVGTDESPEDDSSESEIDSGSEESDSSGSNGEELDDLSDIRNLKLH